MNASAPEMETLKARLKETWMAGDYSLIAKSTETGAEEFVKRLAPEPGTRLLDGFRIWDCDSVAGHAFFERGSGG